MSRPESRSLKEDAEAIVDTSKKGLEQAAADTRRNAARGASDLAETAELTYEDLKDQIEVMRADLSALAESARGAGSAVARDAVREVRRVGRKAVATAEHRYDDAGERVDAALVRAEQFAQERPVAAFGLAAGAGFLMAMALLRR